MQFKMLRFNFTEKTVYDDFIKYLPFENYCAYQKIVK